MYDVKYLITEIRLSSGNDRMRNYMHSIYLAGNENTSEHVRANALIFHLSVTNVHVRKYQETRNAYAETDHRNGTNLIRRKSRKEIYEDRSILIKPQLGLISLCNIGI